VKAGAVVVNSNGTISLPLSSTAPGNYSVTVSYGPTVVTTVKVNFIGTTDLPSTVLHSTKLTVSGLGFQPGEKVDVWLHSDPIHIGTFTADKNGQVTISNYTLPSSVPVGSHAIEFKGQVSGSVSAQFDVTITVSTGGSVLTGSTAPIGAVALLLALGFGAIAITRPKAHKHSV